MRSHTGRLYAFSCTLLVFFMLWALIGAQPWVSTNAAKKDLRLVALERRERALRRKAAAAKVVVDRRWSTYQLRLANRERQISAANDLHLRRLEAAYRSAVAAAVAADARARSAEAYAASVVVWANQQAAARPNRTAAPTTTNPTAAAASRPTDGARPPKPETAPSAKPTGQSPAPAPAPASAPAPSPPPPAPAPKAPPPPPPAPKPAPPPPVVSIPPPPPPVTSTHSS